MFDGPVVPAPLLAALTYARAGLPVLPLHTPGPTGRCSCQRAACDRAGKHPRLPHGLTQASNDPAQVRAWWTRWPTANVALRTGTLTDVCDIDSEAGRDALLRLLGTGTLPGPLVRTGSGGWHVYVAATGYGNRVRVLPDVDWRGVGGYVVAPPSRHACGRPYRWIRPFTADLPGCPTALLRLLAPPSVPRTLGPVRRPDRYARAALAMQSAQVARALVGERNDTLYRAARSLGRLVDAGLLDRRQVHTALAAAAAAAGLGPVETARTIRSAPARSLGRGYRL
jgi:Bifunctional DNA primase/polymerase, N-terminal